MLPRSIRSRAEPARHQTSPRFPGDTFALMLLPPYYSLSFFFFFEQHPCSGRLRRLHPVLYNDI